MKFLARMFSGVATTALGFYARSMSKLLLKFECGELELDVPATETTGDPAKFEELLRQFGGIKGSA